MVVEVHRIRGKRHESVIVSPLVAVELERIGAIKRVGVNVVPKNSKNMAKVIYYRGAV